MTALTPPIPVSWLGAARKTLEVNQRPGALGKTGIVPVEG